MSTVHAATMAGRRRLGVLEFVRICEPGAWRYLVEDASNSGQGRDHVQTRRRPDEAGVLDAKLIALPAMHVADPRGIGNTALL